MKILERSGKQLLIDDEDYDRVIKHEQTYNHKWSVNRKNRTILFWKGVTVVLSRFLLNYNGPLVVDHIDGNPLNNQKTNLRIVTEAINQANRTRANFNSLTKIVGVSYHVARDNYRATVTRNYKQIHIGSFTTKQEAVNAREAFIRNENLNNS